MNEKEKLLVNKENDLPISAEEAQLNAPAETSNADEESEFSHPPSSVRRNLVVGIITAVALLLIFYFFFFNSNNSKSAEATTEKEAEADVTVSVKAARVERETIAQEYAAVGTINPIRQSTVSAPTGAQIVQMPLLKNQFVRKNDVVAVLNSQDLQAQRAEAQAALEEARLNQQTVVKVSAPQAQAQAEKDLADARAGVDNARVFYERRRDLYAKGGIAQKDLEAARLALTNAENNLRLIEKSSLIRTNAANPNTVSLAASKITQAMDRIKTIEAQIALATVRAPLSGFVTDQFQFQGEFAAQGAKLLNIADVSEVVVKANFADTVAANLKLGDAVKVLPNDLQSEEMNGKVTNIARSTDPQNRTIEVWVNLGNGSGKLRAGSAAQVVISTNETNNTLVVPAAAVTLDASNANEGTVMIIGKDNVAHETKVKTGIRQNGKIQIVEGLSGNEQVIVEGNYSLPDKTKVEVQEEGGSDEDDKKDGARSTGEDKKAVDKKAAREKAADEKATKIKATGEKAGDEKE